MSEVNHLLSSLSWSHHWPFEWQRVGVYSGRLLPCFRERNRARPSKPTATAVTPLVSGLANQPSARMMSPEDLDLWHEGADPIVQDLPRSAAAHTCPPGSVGSRKPQWPARWRLSCFARVCERIAPQHVILIQPELSLSMHAVLSLAICRWGQAPINRRGPYTK